MPRPPISRSSIDKEVLTKRILELRTLEDASDILKDLITQTYNANFASNLSKNESQIHEDACEG